MVPEKVGEESGAREIGAENTFSARCGEQSH